MKMIPGLLVLPFPDRAAYEVWEQQMAGKVSVLELIPTGTLVPVSTEQDETRYAEQTAQYDAWAAYLTETDPEGAPARIAARPAPVKQQSDKVYDHPGVQVSYLPL